MSIYERENMIYKFRDYCNSKCKNRIVDLSESYLGINSNFSSNKTYNAFNVFKKKLERTQSPLITSGQNRGINFLQKGPVKSRYVSKSPILSKGCIFNRYKMNIIGGMNNTPSTSSNSNNKKFIS